MFTQADRLIFSATDLINYLGCRHAAFLDFADLRPPRVVAEPDPAQDLLKKKGLVQEQPPASVHVVLGDSSQVSFPLCHFVYYAKLAQRRLEGFAAKPPRTSFGEPCGHCGYCRWNEQCAGEWERIDHLSLVANI